MPKNDVATITNAPTVFTDGILASIDSFEAALKTFEAAGVKVESMSDYGTGFKVVDKATLVGVQFLALEWRFNPSELSPSGFFVSVAVVTKGGDKVIFNDGSAKSGIYAQLRSLTDSREVKGHPSPQCGLLVQDGLSRSDYKFEDTDGKMKPATTFYLTD